MLHHDHSGSMCLCPQHAVVSAPPHLVFVRLNKRTPWRDHPKRSNHTWNEGWSTETIIKLKVVYTVKVWRWLGASSSSREPRRRILSPWTSVHIVHRWRRRSGSTREHAAIELTVDSWTRMCFFKLPIRWEPPPQAFSELAPRQLEDIQDSASETLPVGADGPEDSSSGIPPGRPLPPEELSPRLWTRRPRTPPRPNGGLFRLNSLCVSPPQGAMRRVTLDSRWSNSAPGRRASLSSRGVGSQPFVPLRSRSTPDLSPCSFSCDIVTVLSRTFNDLRVFFKGSLSCSGSRH